MISDIQCILKLFRLIGCQDLLSQVQNRRAFLSNGNSSNSNNFQDLVAVNRSKGAKGGMQRLRFYYVTNYSA